MKSTYGARILLIKRAGGRSISNIAAQRSDSMYSVVRAAFHNARCALRAHAHGIKSARKRAASS